MAKWYGKIGYSIDEEVERGLHRNIIVEREYYGDVIDSKWRRNNNGVINDDISLSRTISIVSDPYAIQHCSHITYVEYLGEKWNVTDINPQFPRILLTLGGISNE